MGRSHDSSRRITRPHFWACGSKGIRSQTDRTHYSIHPFYFLLACRYGPWKHPEGTHLPPPPIPPSPFRLACPLPTKCSLSVGSTKQHAGVGGGVAGGGWGGPGAGEKAKGWSGPPKCGAHDLEKSSDGTFRDEAGAGTPFLILTTPQLPKQTRRSNPEPKFVELLNEHNPSQVRL